MNIRIQVSRQTVKAMQRRLQEAYQRDDVRLVRRIKALLAHLVDGVSAAQVSAHWGFTPACLYQWVMEFILDGLDSLAYQHVGGRSAKLTPTQKKWLTDMLDAGPEAAGFESACWSSILIRVLIERKFVVLYNRFYVCELLRNLGYSFQKARFVSDHLDEAKRQAWITVEWPRIRKCVQWPKTSYATWT